MTRPIRRRHPHRWVRPALRPYTRTWGQIVAWYDALVWQGEVVIFDTVEAEMLDAKGEM